MATHQPAKNEEQDQGHEIDRPKLDERFIKQVDGKEFVIYAGLLDLAHQKHLVSLDVDIIQYPSKDNDHTAVCKAIAKTTTGGPFIDIGDANPENCDAKVSKHLIRMASTRAKARCLRDLTNIGMTALEELGDLNEVIGEDVNNGKMNHSGKGNVKRFPGKQTRSTQNETTSRTDPISKAGNDKVNAGRIPMMSEAQKKAIYAISHRRNIPVEELRDQIMKTFNHAMESLTLKEASTFISTLQKAS